MRILIVEDDIEVQGYIANGLAEQGHASDRVSDGKDGLFMVTTEQYDVVVMDRMLPTVDGLSIIRTMRASGNKTPVLILSALGDVDDRVKGLRAGGDDYLVKPFAFSELLARIEALQRRSTDTEQQETVLRAGDLEMDLLGRRVSRNGRQIELQSREFRLLEYLLRHKGQVVTRTMLLENVWDYHFDPQTNVIDVHISRLRGKINKNAEEQMIRTIRGAGYIIEG